MSNDSTQTETNTVHPSVSSHSGQTGDIILGEKEAPVKEQAVKAKGAIDSQYSWFSSPLIIGLASAIFGVVGTAVGAGLQGYSNFQLERQKFEFTLIQKSLETKDTDEAAKRLQFLVDSGVIKSLDSNKIRELAESPKDLPNFTPPRTTSSGTTAGAGRR
jgi:hypothetical protein